MRASLARPGRVLAFKGIIVQIVVGTAALLLAVFFAPEKVISTSLGFIAFIVPHSLFAYWLFRYAGATKTREVAQSLSQGMKVKLALTTLIFVIAFAVYSADPMFLIGTYAITMASQWAAMFYLGSS